MPWPSTARSTRPTWPDHEIPARPASGAPRSAGRSSASHPPDKTHRARPPRRRAPNTRRAKPRWTRGSTVYMLLIVVAVTAVPVPFGLVGLLIWRWRRTYKDAARAKPPFRAALYPLHGVTRAAQPLPEAQRAHELPAEL